MHDDDDYDISLDDEDLELNEDDEINRNHKENLEGRHYIFQDDEDDFLVNKISGNNDE
jgi:hypothetical protein